MTSEYEKLEIELLFEAMFQRYGFDFRSYAPASAYRRILQHIKKNKIKNISQLQHQIIYDKHAADNLLMDLSINFTEMFRDPLFFKYLRQQILPELSQHDYLKIWHAGCSTGEEAYSMAILLQEQNLLMHSQIYATDFNNEILSKAQQGTIETKKMHCHISNYQTSGGSEDFANYYEASHEHCMISKELKTKIQFSHHNLTSQSGLDEINLIICRNVLIYFNKKLQEHVFNLFAQSLVVGGLLCLGSHESLSYSPASKQFDIISKQFKIYRKK